MSDSFEFTLHSPMTKDDWNKLLDVEHENTMSVTFQTPQGRQVRYIKCEVLDKIRAEIHATAEMHEDGDYYLRDEWIDEVIDKYKAESEAQE